jgi:hypothetical protein
LYSSTHILSITHIQFSNNLTTGQWWSTFICSLRRSYRHSWVWMDLRSWLFCHSAVSPTLLSVTKWLKHLWKRVREIRIFYECEMFNYFRIVVGHEATVITPYQGNSQNSKYHEIFIPEILTVFENSKYFVWVYLEYIFIWILISTADEFDPFVIHKMPQILVLSILHGLGSKLVPVVMEHPKVVEFMKSGEKYDICFLEVFHASAFTVS